MFKFYWKKENQMLILQIRLFSNFTFSFFEFVDFLFLSLYSLEGGWANCVLFFFLKILFFFEIFFFKGGWTPLHVAAVKGFEEIIKIFIEHRANVNIQNNVPSFSFFFNIFFFPFFHFISFLFFHFCLCYWVLGNISFDFFWLCEC